MSQLLDNITTVVNSRGDSGYVGLGLLAVGVAPMGFFSNPLETLYFALLIPPAAYHCYLWGKKIVYPVVLTWLKKK